MGLRKQIVEHNCLPLPEKVAAELNGGYTGINQIRNAINRERNIRNLTKVLKDILDAEYWNPTEKRDFMDRALRREWRTEDEAEAVRRVYMEFYGTKEESD